MVMVKEQFREQEKKLSFVFFSGLVIRLIFMPITAHAALWERITNVDKIFILGLNPLLSDPGRGISFYLFSVPFYILYLFFNYFGIYYNFLLDTFFKIPPLIGDVIVFYSLYQLTQLTLKDEKKSLSVASIYFLNPYVIWMTSVVGHAEQLMVAFIMLAILYLFKNKIRHSAICLSIATFFRYLPILFLPSFLVYLWKRRANSSMMQFVLMYVLSSLVLSLPYIFIFLQLYLTSSSTFWSYVNIYLGTSGTTSFHSIAWLTGWTYNFTGFLASLGLWASLGWLFDIRIFMFLYVISSILLFNTSIAQSFPSINRHVIVTFLLFQVTSPLNQHHYLMWVLPFLFLESYKFTTIQLHHSHILWVSNMAIDPLIGNHLRFYFNDTFPFLSAVIEKYWPLVHNNFLELSLSVLSGLFMLLIIIRCLMYNPISYPEASRAIINYKRKHGFIMLLFSGYAFFEILRFSYMPNFYQTYIFAFFVVFLTASFISVFILSYERNGKFLFLKKNSLFSINISKIFVWVSILSLMLILTLIIVFNYDAPVFLGLQVVVLLGLLLVDNRKLHMLNLYRFSFVFTVLYCCYVLLATKNELIGYFLIPYIFSGFYLEIIGYRD
jgi:hypothetical protein